MSSRSAARGIEQGQRWVRRTDPKRLAEVAHVRQVLVTFGTGEVLHMLTPNRRSSLEH